MLGMNFAYRSGKAFLFRGRYSRLIFELMLFAFFIFFTHPSLASPEAAYRHNSRGIERLQSGDFPGAIEDLRIAHRYLPSNERIRKNLGIAYNNYAFHLKQSGKLRESIRQYNNALQYDRDNVFTHYNLGQAYYLVQDMPRARAHLEKAHEIDPSMAGVKSLLERVKGQGRVETGFDRNETLHFIIASDSSVDTSKVAYIRTHLEEAYGRVGMILGHYPRRKTVAVIVAEDHYDNLLEGAPPWALGIYDGKLRIPADRFKYTENDVRNIIYHEYAHVVVRDLTGGNCPIWLNEGIAGLAESLVEPKERELIQRYLNRFGLVRLRNMPDDFKSIGRRDIMTLLYIESYLLVEFLVRKVGYEGLNGILVELGKGNNVWYAITGITGQGMADFEKEWERFLSSQYGWDGEYFS